MRIPLSRPLLHFLQTNGYAYMQLRGIEKKAESDIYSPDLPQDNYILVPHKEEIFQFEELRMNLERIDSTAITDMLYVDSVIQFWIEVPDALGILFESTKTS